jgi:hypothetical protein
VSQVRTRVRGGDERAGGILGYPLTALYEEVAFVSYHFHWAPNDVLSLEHADRRRWVQEISSINERINAGDEDR